MPKITRYGGPSIEGPRWEGTEPLPAAESEQVEEVSEPSDGNSSSTSPEKPLTSDEPNGVDLQSPVPTTESLSEVGQTESSGVPSTDGSTPETGSSQPEQPS